MADFEIKGTVSKENIPTSRGQGSRKDYSELFDKFDRISDGNSIHLTTTKKHLATGIKNAFQKKYGKSKVTVTQRTQKGKEELDVYIIRN